MTSFVMNNKECAEEYCNLNTCYEDIIELIRNEIIQNYYDNTYDNHTRIQNLQSICDVIAPEFKSKKYLYSKHIEFLKINPTISKEDLIDKSKNGAIYFYIVAISLFE